MGSIRKRSDRSRYYYVRLWVVVGATSDGRPVRKLREIATRTTERTVAAQILADLERLQAEATAGQDMARAVKRFLARLEISAGPKEGAAPPAKQFFENYIALKRATLAQKTMRTVSDILRHFTVFLNERASAPLSSITHADLTKYRDLEIRAGKSANTVNKSLSILGSAFAEAEAQRLIEANPARGLQLKGAKKTAQQREPISWDLFRALVASAKGEWQTFILMSGYTGARQQEVAQLKWGCIDIRTQQIRIWRPKNRAWHVMPMHRCLQAHLQTLSGGSRPDSYIMPTMAGYETRKISKIFREQILARAGVVQPYQRREAGKAGRKLAAYGVHSFRHALVSWLSSAGANEAVRMAVIGHDDSRVHRQYTHTISADARAAMDALPGVE